MSSDKENTNKLTPRDRELAAIGAAIASNCVPCIEYHIPMGRKVGLSDRQILEAVELADKVRKVPADKVLQTAHALLKDATGPDCLDNQCSGADNNEKGCGSDETEKGQRESAGKADFDCSRMMKIMGKCCPEKMKDFSSLMDAMGGCSSTE